jgi:hypothetical protein
MAATSGKQFSVGFRQARIYALDSRGLIAAASPTVPYEGVQVPSVKALEMTIPDVRRIVHVGDDRIQAQDILPRIEASSGVLRVGRNDHDVYELITDTIAREVGEISKIGYATDKQGTEIDIAMLAFQQSLDAVARTRRYRSYAFPLIKAVPVPGTMDENPAEFTFNLLPQVSAKSIWGESYAELVDGYLESEFDEWMTVDYPHVVAWLGDNTETEFLFHTDRPAVSTAKIAGVWTAAAAATSATLDATAVKATTKVTPTVKPAAGELVICVYEYAA